MRLIVQTKNLLFLHQFFSNFLSRISVEDGSQVVNIVTFQLEGLRFESPFNW